MDCSSIEPGIWIPALLTRISILLNFFSTDLTKFSSSKSLEQSHFINSDFPPLLIISSEVVVVISVSWYFPIFEFSCMSAINTFAPNLPNSNAIPLPIP